MFMRCVGLNDNYTMSVPLQILKPLAGDFDGDVLNILYKKQNRNKYRKKLCWLPILSDGDVHCKWVVWRDSLDILAIPPHEGYRGTSEKQNKTPDLKGEHLLGK